MTLVKRKNTDSAPEDAQPEGEENPEGVNT